MEYHFLLKKLYQQQFQESTDYIFDFQDYVLDLTGKDGRLGGDTVNTIYSELITYIDSTGELVTLNQQDSFYYYTEFIFSPEYALGYLGTDTLILVLK